MRWSLLLALLATAAGLAQAQPASQRVSSSSADLLRLPPLDNDALESRADAARRAGPAPLRFAEPVEVALDAKLRTGWSTAPDGTRVWRLVVSSPGAYSLSFGFDRFRLPQDASLWIYPEGQDPEYRAFTAADNEAHGELWTPIVPGDRAVIELNLPPAKPSALEDYELELGQVNHAFRPALLTDGEKAAAGAGASGSCNVDVVCPEGDDYRDIIRSVGAYTVRGVDRCSGAAINTTVGDGQALFLTAEHCGVTSSSASQVVVYWNFQNSTCRAPGSPESGRNGDGARTQFNTGTVMLADGAAADWSVLEFDDPILAEALVYLAGWDRRDVAPSMAIAIHHPSVEEKRISLEGDPTSITNYASNSPSSSASYIRIADWDVGTTEGGSSGSPLFDSNRRIVGQLSGGAAACGNDEPDWYGRTHSAMFDGLDAILDPGDTGAETVDGMDAVASASAGATVSASRAQPGESVGFTFNVLNPTSNVYSSARVTNILPVGLTLDGSVTASTGAATVSGQGVTWSGTIGAGTELVLRYQARVDDDAVGALTNSATITLGDGSSDLLAESVLTVFRSRPAPDAIYQVTPSLRIPDAGCTAYVDSEITVTDDFVLDRVSVGVNATHTYRGDLSVRLTSPSGTRVVLIDRIGTGANGSNASNLDVLIDDDAVPGAFDGGDHSTASPYYDIEGAPESGSPGGAVGALSEFAGESAAGTWTLGICDGASQDLGTLNRWSLLLVRSGRESTETQEEPPSRTALVQIVGANPFDVSTEAHIEVAGVQRVRAVLIDATGRVVRAVLEGDVAGSRTVSIQRSTLSAGSYFLHVETEGQSQTVPLTVLR
ncbi:proprotein convertase P-domain-containing protein [Rubrivirga sp.]|uniref:proprotein convertase P-domain-containing protein n=1 Tax=Rubrivirga sp. TaxID=1885344 RepID=UPI003C70DEE5